MSPQTLCTVGHCTQFWSVDNDIECVRKLTIPDENPTVVHWNHNNNYILICTEMGNMFLQSVKKDTVMSTCNQVNEEKPLKITCASVLAGSRLVITGDEGGNIRIWPVSKAGFEKPIFNEKIANCFITSFSEADDKLIYASTSKGHIVKVNLQLHNCDIICQLADESILDLCQCTNSLLASTQSGMLYRIYPGIQRYTTVFESREHPLHLSKSFGFINDYTLLYTEFQIELLYLPTMTIQGKYISDSSIISCDLTGTTICVSFATNSLGFMSTTSMNDIDIYQDLEETCFLVQFNRQRNIMQFAPKSVEASPIKQFSKSQPIQPTQPMISSRFESPSHHNVSPIVKNEMINEKETTMEEMQHSFHSSVTDSPYEINHQKEVEPPILESPVLATPHKQETEMDSFSSNLPSQSVKRQLVYDVDEDQMNKSMKSNLQPLFNDLKLYIHNEVLDLKDNLVNQLTQQQTIIDNQQRCINMLEKLLHEKK